MNGPLANQFSDFDFDVFCKDFKSHIYKAYLQVCTYYLVLGTKSPDSMPIIVDFFGAKVNRILGYIIVKFCLIS